MLEKVTDREDTLHSKPPIRKEMLLGRGGEDEKKMDEWENDQRKSPVSAGLDKNI